MADLLESFLVEFPPGALAIWLGVISFLGWKMWSRLMRADKELALQKQAHTSLEERIERGFKRNDEMHEFMGDQVTQMGKEVIQVGKNVAALTGAVNKMNGDV